MSSEQNAGIDQEAASQLHQQRVAEVHAWQRHYGMEPRKDSALTELYASRMTPGVPADEIARELVATDHIYKTTLYGEVLEEYMRKVAERLRGTFPGLSWTSTWAIVRAYAPNALKLMCVSSAGIVLPECHA